jgi:hypothetical protein
VSERGHRAPEEHRMSRPWRIVLLVLLLALVIDVTITYLTMY